VSLIVQQFHGDGLGGGSATCGSLQPLDHDLPRGLLDWPSCLVEDRSAEPVGAEIGQVEVEHDGRRERPSAGGPATLVVNLYVASDALPVGEMVNLARVCAVRASKL
jgi:hypothetical protein